MYLLIFAALLFQLDPPLQLFLTSFEEPVRINNQFLHNILGEHVKRLSIVVTSLKHFGLTWGGQEKRQYFVVKVSFKVHSKK